MLGLLVALAATFTAAQPLPDWSKAELRGLFIRAEMAARAANIKAKDNELANIAGHAYRVPRKPGEGVDPYAKRILKKRDPHHPSVREGTWLVALIRQFYSDAGQRAKHLARFERERRDRNYLKKKSAEALRAAAALAEMVVTKVDGVEGFIAPLPVAEGAKPTKVGATAMVNAGVITIEQLDRATFENNAPKPDARRTASGSLRELYAAQKQFNVSAEMLGRVDHRLKKGKGTLRVFIPAQAPAIYLNELARAGKEAGMRRLLIMTVGPNNEGLREIPISLRKRKTRKKKKKMADFRCKDSVTMQACVEWALEVKSGGGQLFYRSSE